MKSVYMTLATALVLFAGSAFAINKPGPMDCPCFLANPVGWYDVGIEVDCVNELEWFILRRSDLFTRRLTVLDDDDNTLHLYTREDWTGYNCGLYAYPDPGLQYELNITDREKMACDLLQIEFRNAWRDEYCD